MHLSLHLGDSGGVLVLLLYSAMNDSRSKSLETEFHFKHHSLITATTPSLSCKVFKKFHTDA